MGMGLEHALRSFRTVVHGLVNDGQKLESALRELEWIVAPGLEKIAGKAHTTSDGLSVKVVHDGTRRHGRAILRI